MQKKLDISEIQLKLDVLNLGFKIIDYSRYTNPSKFIHSCGVEFNMRLDHLLSRKKCPNCHGRKRNLKKFQIASNKKHNNDYQILEFENGNKPVKMRHNICGSEFNQVGHRHLRGDRCPECYRNKKYTKEDLIRLSNEKWKGEYELLSDTINYSEKCLILHNRCGSGLLTNSLQKDFIDRHGIKWHEEFEKGDTLGLEPTISDVEVTNSEVWIYELNENERRQELIVHFNFTRSIY